MQKKLLLLVLVISFALSLPSLSQAWEKERGPNWKYEGVFIDIDDTTATGLLYVSGGHGIVVDKYDRIWVGNYFAGNTGGLVILNPDGTPADFSPIGSVTIGGEEINLAVTNGCRGMNVDHEGNILYGHGSKLIKINVENGEGMALFDKGASITKPAVDAEGYIYVGQVVGAGPVAVLDPATFTVTQEITLEPSPSYTRGIEITPDGKTLISANLTDGGPAYIYTTEDYVTYSFTDTIAVNVLGNNIFRNQVVTMDWGPDGKLWFSHDAAYGGVGNPYNGFVVVDLENKKYSYLEIPMDSTEFNGPRGIGFSPAGDVAYATSFNINRVWKFSLQELLTPGNWVYNDALTNWKFEEVFIDIDDTTAAGAPYVSAGHGVVVDKYDRIWVGSYFAGNTGGLVVFNPDGTPADFSPIGSVTIGGEEINLAVTNGCRGMNVDHEGNILYGHGSRLIKINVENGEGMALFNKGASITKPAVDAEGYIYVGQVVGAGPVAVLDPATFTVTQEITLEPSPSYTRGIEISPDGKTLVSGNLTDGGPVFIYTTEDYVTYTFSDSISVDVDGYPVFKFQCVTMDWDPDGNLWISHDASYAPGGRVHNGFVIVDLETKEYDYFTMPLDTNEYNGPRGIGFTDDGKAAYTTSFNIGRVWKLTRLGTSVDNKEFVSPVPASYELGQNYPNPFNPTTTIPFSLSKPGTVELTIYDILGREVETLLDRQLQIGNHKAIFDAKNLASGVYFYKIKVNGVVQSKRMLLIK